MHKDLLKKYASVLVRVGINLKKDQYLVLQCNTDSLELARYVTEEAFKEGAKDVIVYIEDPMIKSLRAKYCDIEDLSMVPDFKKESLDYYLRQDACQMGIMGTYPHLMDDVDNDKVIALAKADNELRNVVRKHIHSGRLKWTGTVFANLEWAKMVYDNLDDEEALAKLEDDLVKMMRLDEDDPIDAWLRHAENLKVIADKLNEYNFKKIHITTELGTNLEIELVKGHIWNSALDGDLKKVRGKYIANMPTEEIFTDPHRNKVNGIVYASLPLMMSNKLVEDFYIEFKNGLATNCGAKKNEDVLRSALFKDDNTRRLGEVALVSKNSMISKMNRIYYNGLIDENAKSHLAFGSSFTQCILNGSNMSEDELLMNGVNVASSHHDFMIGTDDMMVIGTTHDGKEIVVMSKGEFVL